MSSYIDEFYEFVVSVRELSEYESIVSCDIYASKSAIFSEEGMIMKTYILWCIFKCVDHMQSLFLYFSIKF